jgi:phosphomethylpyrimidine synthase
MIMNYFLFEPSRVANGEIDWPKVSPKGDLAVRRRDRRFRWETSSTSPSTPSPHGNSTTKRYPGKCKSPHFCSMKITEDVRKYAGEQAISEEAALQHGMQEKSKEFVDKGAEVYAKV